MTVVRKGWSSRSTVAGELVTLGPPVQISLGNSTQTAPQPYSSVVCLWRWRKATVSSIRQKYACHKSLYMPTLQYTTCRFNTAGVRPWSQDGFTPLLNGIAGVTCLLHKHQATPVRCYCSASTHYTTACVMARAPFVYPGLLCHVEYCLELDRAKSSSSTLCRAPDHSTCFHGRHTNQGLL